MVYNHIKRAEALNNGLGGCTVLPVWCRVAKVGEQGGGISSEQELRKRVIGWWKGLEFLENRPDLRKYKDVDKGSRIQGAQKNYFSGFPVSTLRPR